MTHVELRNLAAKLRTIYANPQDNAFIYKAADELDRLTEQVSSWKAEQIDDFEIRVISPEGESWRLRSADRNDVFNNFIWRWAQGMIIKGGKE